MKLDETTTSIVELTPDRSQTPPTAREALGIPGVPVAVDGGPPALASPDRGAPDVAGELRRDQVFTRLFAKQKPAVTIGRFTVLELIGAGGMGELFAAYDPDLDRKVALKLVRPDRCKSQVAEQRLLREAQAAARLSHPNVVPVYEAGTVDGRVFMAMEFVHGEDLSAWLRIRREPLEILGRFLAAGRGLAAVHAAGLAHRDFKPANVLVGEDGRVRIVDFGLARTTVDISTSADGASSGSASGSSPGPASASRSGNMPGQSGELTVPGTIMGTPRYMAPEQWRAQRGDARSDQFSFCVALYAALYGIQPYGGKHGEEILESIEAGTISRPKRSPKLPQKLREALVRGLAEDPDARWPDMEGLLAVLEGPLGRPRRRKIAALISGVGALALGLGLGAGVLVGEEEDPCAIDGEALAGTWDEGMRTRLSEAFVATGMPFAADSASTVTGALDHWSADWQDQRLRSCRATHVEGVQSTELLDLRTGCLERKRRAFAGVIETFVQADAAVINGAGDILEELPRLMECSNPEALDARHPLPAGGELREQILDDYERLAEAQTLRSVGQAAEARAKVAAVLANREAQSYLPLRLEAQGEDAKIIKLVDPGEAMVQLRETAAEAEREGLTSVEADLRVDLARGAAGHLSEPRLEAFLIDDAELALARLGQADDARALPLMGARARLREQAGDYEGALDIIGAALTRAEELEALPEQRARLRQQRANLERQLGRYELARAIYLELHTEVRERWGERHLLLADLEYNLGVLSLDEGDFETAKARIESARSIIDATRGRGTMASAEASFALAKIDLSTGRFEAALEAIEAIEPIYVREHGQDHMETARARSALGVVRFYTGDYEGSLTSYRAALPTFSRVLGPDSDELGLMHSNIGESLLALGRHDEAVEAFSLALETLARALPEGHPYFGVPLKARGQSRFEVGELDGAKDDLEAALVLLERHNDEPVELAETRLALARVLAARRGQGELERARSLALQARAGFEELGLDARAAAAGELAAE